MKAAFNKANKSFLSLKIKPPRKMETKSAELDGVLRSLCGALTEYCKLGQPKKSDKSMKLRVIFWVSAVSYLQHDSNQVSVRCKEMQDFFLAEKKVFDGTKDIALLVKNYCLLLSYSEDVCKSYNEFNKLLEQQNINIAQYDRELLDESLLKTCYERIKKAKNPENKLQLQKQLFSIFPEGQVPFDRGKLFQDEIKVLFCPNIKANTMDTPSYNILLFRHKIYCELARDHASKFEEAGVLLLQNILLLKNEQQKTCQYGVRVLKAMIAETYFLFGCLALENSKLKDAKRYLYTCLQYCDNSCVNNVPESGEDASRFLIRLKYAEVLVRMKDYNDVGDQLDIAKRILFQVDQNALGVKRFQELLLLFIAKLCFLMELDPENKTMQKFHNNIVKDLRAQAYKQYSSAISKAIKTKVSDAVKLYKDFERLVGEDKLFLPDGKECTQIQEKFSLCLSKSFKEKESILNDVFGVNGLL